MNPIFSRTLKALSTLLVAAVLTACGSGSTVDPFKPTRVVGLGDGYALATNSVVSQVAAGFGQSSIVSSATSGGVIADLSAQIAQVPGGVTSTDLVVISVGTNDLKGGLAQVNYAASVGTVVTQIQGLLGTTKHVLVMPVLDLSRTPWGRAPNPVFSATATADFNRELLNQLQSNFGSRTPNPVIFGDSGLSPISSRFLGMTNAISPIWISPLNQYDFQTSCNGCSLSASLFDTATSDTYLTAAGMQWAGNMLYAATAQGWR